MACTGCAARRARAAKWFAIAADRARSLIKRTEKPDANPPEATPTVSAGHTPAQDA
jgi:hypothetical protein